MKCAMKTSLVALCALLPAVGATRASLVADVCEYNTYMCCWTENDNGVEDNADVCLVNGEFQEGDETVHCHGLVWAEGASFESFILPLYKYVRTFDHRDARGYYGRIQGAPQCECIEKMPIVTRADCTTYSSQGLVACKNNDLRTHYNGVMERPGGELPNLIKNCDKARGKEDQFPKGDDGKESEDSMAEDVPEFEDTMGEEEDQSGQDYEDPVDQTDEFGEGEDTSGLSYSYDEGTEGEPMSYSYDQEPEEDGGPMSYSYDQEPEGDGGGMGGGPGEGEEEDPAMSYDQGDEGVGGDPEEEEEYDPLGEPEKNTLDNDGESGPLGGGGGGGDDSYEEEDEMVGCPEEHEGDSSDEDSSEDSSGDDKYHSNEYYRRYGGNN